MQNNSEKKIKTIPDNYSSVTPWIISPSSAKLIEFLTAAFGAEEIPNSRVVNPDGIIIHVVVRIGTALIMLFDSRDGWPPTPSFLNLYVENIEKTYQRSIELGSRPVTDITMLWFGEKVCRILDPFGNLWWINERVEEVDFTNPEDVGRRASTAEAIAGIAYIQRSLDKALKTQKSFFESNIKN